MARRSDQQQPTQTILGHTNLGPLPIAGGVNLNPIGAADNYQLDTGPADGEALVSLNWRHKKGFLLPRDELVALVGPSTSSDPVLFPGGANPTSRLTGLFPHAYEDRSTFLMIHDATHFWSYNGTAVTDRSVASLQVPAAGLDTDPWDADAALNRYLFCNGACELHFWDGASATATRIRDIAGYQSTVTPLISRYVAGFAGRCFIAHTSEGAFTRAQRVRWCADGNLADWLTSAGTGSGATDLADTPGQITGLYATPELLAVFKEDAVVLAQETGDFRSPIAFPTYLKVGCLSGRSVQAIDPQTFLFLGPDDVYQLSGNSFRSIGGKIAADIFYNLNNAAIRQIVSWIIPELDQYYLLIPAASSSYASIAYCYSWSEEHWWKEVYSEVQAATRTNVSPVQRWSDIATTWTATGGAWSSFLSGGSATPFIVASNLHASADSRVRKFVGPSLGTDVAATSFIINERWLSKFYRLNPAGRSTIYNVVVNCFFSLASSINLTVRGYEATGAGQFTSQTITKTASPGYNRLYFPVAVTGLFHQIDITTTGPTTIFNIEPVTAEREGSY